MTAREELVEQLSVTNEEMRALLKKYSPEETAMWLRALALLAKRLS